MLWNSSDGWLTLEHKRDQILEVGLCESQIKGYILGLTIGPVTPTRIPSPSNLPFLSWEYELVVKICCSRKA